MRGSALTRNTIQTLVIGAVVLSACLGNDAGTIDTGPARADGAAGMIQWDDRDHIADLGGGWTVQACGGDSPLMCVDRDGSPVGTIEAIRSPISSFDSLDQAAGDDINLLAFAKAFHEAVAADRAAGCGADYGFEKLGPDEFTLGGGSGVFYGFVGNLPDGAPSELNQQYAAIVGDQVVAITAVAYDEGGCPGRDDASSWDSLSLSEFRPFLERALHDSPLPSE